MSLKRENTKTTTLTIFLSSSQNFRQEPAKYTFGIFKLATVLIKSFFRKTNLDILIIYETLRLSLDRESYGRLIMTDIF